VELTLDAIRAAKSIKMGDWDLSPVRFDEGNLVWQIAKGKQLGGFIQRASNHLGRKQCALVGPYDFGNVEFTVVEATKEHLEVLAASAGRSPDSDPIVVDGVKYYGDFDLEPYRAFLTTKRP
jgi:hypothetical protein